MQHKPSSQLHLESVYLSKSSEDNAIPDQFLASDILDEDFEKVYDVPTQSDWNRKLYPTITTYDGEFEVPFAPLDSPTPPLDVGYKTGVRNLAISAVSKDTSAIANPFRKGKSEQLPSGNNSSDSAEQITTPAQKKVYKAYRNFISFCYTFYLKIISSLLYCSRQSISFCTCLLNFVWSFRYTWLQLGIIAIIVHQIGTGYQTVHGAETWLRFQLSIAQTVSQILPSIFESPAGARSTNSVVVIRQTGKVRFI
jgi:hypothetical protein